jgi:hypothetical protein
MNTLTALRDAYEAADAAFELRLRVRFPGLTRWHWYRALAAIRGENCRRNDDQSNDETLAADCVLKAQHNEYIRLLHVFYRARDGEHGVLGGRGF